MAQLVIEELGTEMTAAVVAAMASKFAKLKKENCDVIKPGVEASFTGRVTMDLQMRMKRGEDTEKTPTTSFPLKFVLMKLFQKAGFQKENMKKFLLEAYAEYEATDAEKMEEILEDTDAAMAEVTDTLKKLPKVAVKGAMRMELCEVEIVKVVPKKQSYVIASSAKESK